MGIKKFKFHYITLIQYLLHWIIFIVHCDGNEFEQIKPRQIKLDNYTISHQDIENFKKKGEFNNNRMFAWRRDNKVCESMKMHKKAKKVH